MTFNNRTREELRAYCSELNEDDGVDPREYFKSDERSGKQIHKTRRLCNQVAQTLSLVLAGEFADERLQDLQVVVVEPAPDASQLLVTLHTHDVCDSSKRQELLNLLGSVSGRLRWEVASAICRKRTPKLLFRIS
jgi:ribosome-binding factor A